jgi:hypothetical protein
MCGPTSAVGLEEHERVQWAAVRDLVRDPGSLTGLMRGFLGEEEVAVVVATDSSGAVRPMAVLVTPFIRGELTLSDPSLGESRQAARVGDYDVEVVVGDVEGVRQPAAVLVTPWIREHLFLYARQLWRSR